MQTLFEKVMQGRIQPADAADIALSLSYLIDSGDRVCHLDPANIGLDEDNQVTILPGERPVDCFYAAPDVVLEGADPSRDAMWFSLGCVLFFMLNHQSYHEAYDLDPFEVAEIKSGVGLVGAECYNGLAADAICALTAWNPAERTRGVGLLIQIAETVPARAVVQYTCNGQVVSTEEIVLTESVDNFNAGRVVESAEHVVYEVLPGAKIPFRPGTHCVSVPVTIFSPLMPEPQVAPAPAPVSSTWLVVSFPNPQNPGRPMVIRLLPMDDKPRGKLVPVSLLQTVRYQFYSIEMDSVTGRFNSVKELFFLNIPADTNRKRAALHVRYHVRPKGFSVALVDEQNQLISNARHFQMM